MRQTLRLILAKAIKVNGNPIRPIHAAADGILHSMAIAILTTTLAIYVFKLDRNIDYTYEISTISLLFWGSWLFTSFIVFRFR